MGPGVITRRHLIFLALWLAPWILEPRPALARQDDGPLAQELIVQELAAEAGAPRRAASGRFRVQSAGDPVRLARLLASFETAYRAFWKSLPERRPGGQAVTVVVFARPESLRRFAARLGVAQPAFDAGGVFLREPPTIAVASASRLERVVEAALVHEAAHLLNVEILGPSISPWLNEGLAGFCQYSAVTPDGYPRLGVLDEGSELSVPREDGSEVHYQFMPKRSVSYLLGQFFRDHHLSAGPTLDVASPESFYGEGAQLHYAASWTLVHLLAQGRTRPLGELRPRLDRYAALEREGGGGRAALLRVLEMSMEELDEAWRRHVKRLW